MSEQLEIQMIATLRGPDFGFFDSAIYRPIRPFWTHVSDETQALTGNVLALLYVAFKISTLRRVMSALLPIAHPRGNSRFYLFQAYDFVGDEPRKNKKNYIHRHTLRDAFANQKCPLIS